MNGELIFDGEDTTYKENDDANNFNRYFVNSIKSIIDNIETNENENNYCTSDIWCENVLESFELIDSKKLRTIVFSLSNKMGTDEGISTDILKKSYDLIEQIFVDIINHSLKNGIFPDNWKTSTVIPIRKVNNTKKASEFRPVNKLPLYEKVLELIVKEQLNKYLGSNKVLSEEQSGFREKHSCETALQTVLNDWKIAIDAKKIIGVIFLDLKRAFEIVDRKILLNKLIKYGIKGIVLKWFKSYLNNRKQVVKYNNILSDEIEVEYGIAQGSVLGPILFIVYINDLVRYLKNIFGEECKTQLFADDTLIYVEGDSEREIEFRIQRVFITAQEWLNNNKLMMTVKKLNV